MHAPPWIGFLVIGIGTLLVVLGLVRVHRLPKGERRLTESLIIMIGLLMIQAGSTMSDRFWLMCLATAALGVYLYWSSQYYSRRARGLFRVFALVLLIGSAVVFILM